MERTRIFLFKQRYAEENVSAKEEEEKKNARIFKTAPHRRWAPRTPVSSAKAALDALGLTAPQDPPMLPKKFRLVRWQWHGRAPGATGRRGHLLVRTAKTDLPYSRFGVVVPLRTEHRAVRRNRLRRSVYDYIERQELPRAPGKDVLVLLLAGAAELAANDLEKELTAINAAVCAP